MLEPDRLRVLTNRPGGWQPIAEPAWSDRPDWDAITSTPNTSAAAGSTTAARPVSGRHRMSEPVRLRAQGAHLGPGGAEPEHHGLGKKDDDYQRGEGACSDALVGWPVTLTQPHRSPQPCHGQVSDGKGGQQRSHAASIAGLHFPYTFPAGRGELR